jgi:hypothetical protein
VKPRREPLHAVDNFTSSHRLLLVR